MTRIFADKTSVGIRVFSVESVGKFEPRLTSTVLHLTFYSYTSYSYTYYAKTNYSHTPILLYFV